MTHSPSQMPELKRCPFCGASAKEYISDQRFVCCSDEKCPAHEIVSYANEWNTRAASVPCDLEAEQGDKSLEKQMQDLETLSRLRSGKPHPPAVAVDLDDQRKIVEALILREWNLNSVKEGSTFGSVANATAQTIVEYFALTPPANADLAVVNEALEVGLAYVLVAKSQGGEFRFTKQRMESDARMFEQALAILERMMKGA